MRIPYEIAAQGFRYRGVAPPQKKLGPASRAPDRLPAHPPNDLAVELPALGQQHFWSMNVRSDSPSAHTSDFL